MKTLRYLTILLLGTAVVSCTCEKPQQAKNVIFLIGDGMGFGAVSSLLLSEDDSTAFEQAPVIGYSLHDRCCRRSRGAPPSGADIFHAVLPFFIANPLLLYLMPYAPVRRHPAALGAAIRRSRSAAPAGGI